MEAIWDQNAGVFGIQGEFYLPKSKNKLWLIVYCKLDIPGLNLANVIWPWHGSTLLALKP